MIQDINEVIKHYPEFTGIHPACLAVPSINEDGFMELAGDIKENGLLEPIIRKDGLLLDGRTRLLACYETNTEIRVRDHVGSADPWTLVHEWNILRRHLTTGQKAMFADEWRSDEEFKALERKKANGGDKKSEVVTLPRPVIGSDKWTCSKCNHTWSTQDKECKNCRSIGDTGKSRDKIGEKVGVSGSSVDKARTIKETVPEVAKQVLSGEVTLEAGYKEARKVIKEKAALPTAEEQKPKPSAPVATLVTAGGVESSIQAPKQAVFNQTNDSVDWARWTWNPVTGCNHGCKFCYAREIANSQRMAPYYPNKFEPTFHEYRLSAPKHTRVPDSGDDRDGRVFVCSMADLFGKWVPDEWIEKVFASCVESPEWEYLFLTKWPARYAQMPLLKKAWYGASVIQQSDVERVENAMKNFETDCTKWISLEPMLQPIRFNDLSWCDLVVIGSQTATTQPEGYVPSFAPKFDWVVDVVNQCREFGVPYYIKANMGLVSPGMDMPKSMPRKR